MSESIMDLLRKQEPLRSELAAYLQDTPIGPCIRHPLVYCIMYGPEQNAYLNAMLKQKQVAVTKAKANRDWDRYIFLHERPYRVEALASIIGNMDPADYWRLLGEVWIDSENIHQNLKLWRDLWMGIQLDRGKRKSVRWHTSSPIETHRWVMAPDDVEKLYKMPTTITVWRGANPKYPSAPNGMSWTLDREKARWFATRLLPVGERGAVYERKINRVDVGAYFTVRGESEIVLPKTGPVTRVEEDLVEKLDK